MSASPESGAAHTPRILLVDDDVDSREMYAIVLTASGFHVEQANDASCAMERVVAACPDVAVLDIALPQIDGIELCRLIRRSTPHKRPALVALTALRLGASDTDRVRDAGFDALLLKPCLPEYLVGEVRRLLAQSMQLQHDTLRIASGAGVTVRKSVSILEQCSRTSEFSRSLRHRDRPCPQSTQSPEHEDDAD